MLGNPTRFAGSDVGFANAIEQCRFPVIDVPHDRDDWRPWPHLFKFVFLVQLDSMDGRMNDSGAFLPFFNLEPKAVLRAKLLRD